MSGDGASGPTPAADQLKSVLVLLSGVTLVALVYVYRKWVQTRNYWPARNVPSSPPHPLLGSLNFLLKQNPDWRVVALFNASAGLLTQFDNYIEIDFITMRADWMRDRYDRSEPYFGVWWFWRPALVINSPELARAVLVRDAAVFRDRYLNSGRNDPIGSLNLFVANDPLWSTMRKHISPVFTSSRLRHSHAYVKTKSTELLHRIKMELETKKRVNLRLVFTDYTTDVIGEAVFGVSSDATLTGTSPLRTITKDFMNFTYIRALALVCIFFIPDLVPVFRFTFFPKAATDYFRKVFKSIVDQRGGYDTQISKNSDFIDTLRRIKQESNRRNEEMPEDVLVAQAAAILLGGFDTTGSVLSFCLYELAHHPTAQDNIYEELLPIKESILNDDFDAELLSEKNYLNCVIKECLRKYPPMGWLDRLTSTEYQLDERLTLAAGTPVYVNTMGMHYDPEYFPDPYKFVPERFLPENEKKIKPYTFMPFGHGPRGCIGVRFAMQNMNCVLAKLVLKYRLVPAPGTPHPEHVKVENRGLFYVPGEDLYVDFVQREVQRVPPSNTHLM